MASYLWWINGFLWGAWIFLLDDFLPGIGAAYDNAILGFANEHSATVWANFLIKAGSTIVFSLSVGLVCLGGLSLAAVVRKRFSDDKSSKVPSIFLCGLLGLWILTAVAKSLNVGQ